MADYLTLGSVIFDQFSTPTEMMAGGNQALVVHKLPGGQRVIDTLGPDEADITWSGQFYGDNAYTNALTVDGIRAGGQVVPLTWGGQFRQVIVSNFIYKVRRLPTWVMYSVTCTVYQNPMQGPLGGFQATVDTLIGTDLTQALGIK